MNSPHIQSLSQAAQQHLLVLNAPTSAPSLIKSSSEKLQALTQSLDAPNALFLSQSLLQTQLQQVNHPVTNFAFHILEKRVLSHSPYDSLPQDFRVAVRQLAVQLLQAVGAAAPMFLKRSVIRLYASLGVREWPQQWPDWLPPLFSFNHGAISCAILSEVSESVNTFSGISNQRRQQLKESLAENLDVLLSFMVDCTKKFVSMGNDGSFGLSECLMCMTSFIEWANLCQLFEAGIEKICLELLRHDSVKNQALGALEVLVGREVDPGKGLNDAVFRSLFTSVMQVVATSKWVNLSGSRDHNGIQIDEDLHEFRLRIYDMLQLLGSRHFVSSFLFSRRGIQKLSSDEEQCAIAFFQLMLSAFASCSLRIRGSASIFIHSLMHSFFKMKIENVDALNFRLFPLFVEATMQVCCKALIKWPQDQLEKKFQDIEYDEDYMYRSDVSILNTRIHTTIWKASLLRPYTASKIAFARMYELLRTISIPAANIPASGVERDSGAVIISDGTPYGWRFGGIKSMEVWRACFEAACTEAEGMAYGITVSNEKLAHEELVNSMKMCFELVGAKLIPELGYLQAHALRSFSWLYAINNEAMDMCVDIISKMIATGKNEKSRYRSCVTLGVLFRKENAGSSHIAVYAPVLSKYCVSALSGSDFRTSEKFPLLEATLSSVLAIKNPTEKVKYIEGISQPLFSALLNQQVASILSSPAALFKIFNDAPLEGVQPIVDAMSLLERAVHMVVRPVVRSKTTIPVPGVLSHSVAPRAVDFACALVTCLHSMYNRNKSGLDDRARKSSLQPTSQEVARYLNLNVAAARELISGDIYDGELPGRKPSISELRAMKTLEKNGIECADENFAWIRERFCQMRISAYEIIRAAILSGVTHSTSHLERIVTAICSDLEAMEPVHLNELVQRILRYLFSFMVTSSGSAYLNLISSSKLVQLVQLLKNHIVAAQEGKAMFSESSIMDISRRYGRSVLARSVADMIGLMYPKVENSSTEQNTYFPEVFRAGQLGVEMKLLWEVICNPGAESTDMGAAHVGLGSVKSAVEAAPTAEFAFFESFIHVCIRTATRGYSTSEPSAVAAIACLSSILLKWPAQSRDVLLHAAQNNTKVVQWTSAMVETHSTAPRAKTQRSLVKEYIEKIAQWVGLDKGAGSQVQKLPDMRRTSRRRRDGQNGAEDLLLAENAIDSLFGDGDPL